MTREETFLRKRGQLGFGSRYICPGCGRQVPKERQVWYGPFVAHRGCTVTCSLCNEAIPEPQLGQPKHATAWCGYPVHIKCKQAEMTADEES